MVGELGDELPKLLVIEGEKTGRMVFLFGIVGDMRARKQKVDVEKISAQVAGLLRIEYGGYEIVACWHQWQRRRWTRSVAIRMY